ncbi:MAG: PIN domain-containing protein [Candidatus Diapherotrites archaeon]|nr:PIN domain-containing protein [Candidatus Diapherotrites archaeon]
MKKILLDTSAIILHATKERDFEKIDTIFKSISSGNAQGIISGITLTEIIYVVGRQSLEKAFNMIAFLEESHIKAIDCTTPIFVNAGNISLKYRQKNLSIADSIIIATAIAEKADEVASSDKVWKNVKEIKLAEI